MTDTPEQLARKTIDELLTGAGWQIQDRKRANITAGRGVAIREFPLKPGYGFADYLLYLDGAAAGVVEAKKDRLALTGVEAANFPLLRRPAGRSSCSAPAIAVPLPSHQQGSPFHKPHRS